jgi:hypothetical protein
VSVGLRRRAGVLGSFAGHEGSLKYNQTTLGGKTSMSAKPPIWHPVAAIALGCAHAPAGCARTQSEPSSVTQSTSDQDLNVSDIEAMNQFEAIGYLDGFEEAEDTASQTVTVHDKSQAYRGFNLYYSGHDTEAILMDINGNIFNHWRRKLRDFWPEFEKTTILQPTDFWTRVHLFEDRFLLALFDGILLIKIDKNSQLISQYRNRLRHDFFVVNNDGSFVVLTRKTDINPDYHDENPILEDFVTFFDRDGEETRKISILEAIENSDYRALLNQYRYRRFSGNILHTNTLEVLDGTLADRIPAFRQGNILLSILKLDTIAVLDPDREKIVWAITGLTPRQHQPTLLPNGNVLVTESNGGRAFELNRARKIVREFVSPHRTRHDETKTANLFELLRIEPECVASWLDVER